MQPTRLSRDDRRQQILECALPLFARHGFGGTTTRRIADAAGISEALLFKHFPTKSAIYAAILADICTADPGLARLRAEPPSTRTLALIVRGMTHYFISAADGSDAEGNQKLRLTFSSYLEDGEFAKILFDKVEQVITPIFVNSLDHAIAVGDAVPGSANSRNLFWFAHHTLCTLAATQMPLLPSLDYPPPVELEREVCSYILRGIGLTDAAIEMHAALDIPFESFEASVLEFAQMTLSAETEVSARTAYRKPKTDKPVRTKLWFSIMVVLMALLVGVFWGFNQFRNHMIAQFFANMKMPPATVSVADVKSEVLPNLLTGIGDVVAVHQVNVTTDVAARVVKIMFKPGTHVVKGQPLVQLFDDPDQGDLASFEAQARGAKLSLDRAKALALRQFGPQATVDDQQATYDQAMAGIAKTKAIISQKLILAPFDGELGLRHIDVGQFLSAGTQIVTLTDLSQIWVNFTVTEKNSAELKLGQTVNISVDSYPGRVFTGKITTIEPQVSTDTRNIMVQATFENPDHALKPGMFATATVVLPSKAPVMTVPETAADYSLYGDSVFLIKKSQGADGKPALTAERTFVKTGERIDGRVVIASKDIKPGDQVVAVGQIKLQSGVPVAISSDPPPKIPAEPSPY